MGLIDTWVIVPTRRAHELVDQALATAALELASEDQVTMIHDEGVLNLHELWNTATNVCDGESVWQDEAYYLYLNDDCVLGSDHIARLRECLHNSPELGVISLAHPSADTPPAPGWTEAASFGEGRFSGWAFMVRRSAGYRFPAWLTWWCGDLHVQVEMQRRGFKVGILNDSGNHYHETSSTLGKTRDTDPEFKEAITDDYRIWRRWLDDPTNAEPLPRPGRYGFGRGVSPPPR